MHAAMVDGSACGGDVVLVPVQGVAEELQEHAASGALPERFVVAQRAQRGRRVAAARPYPGLKLSSLRRKA